MGKYIPLKVSAPFHSELMIASSKIFQKKTTNIKFKKAEFDTISNHQLKNYKEIPETEYIDQLSLQIHSPVMWSDTMKKIIETGVGSFLEIGPKKTLLNLISKDFNGERISITDSESIKNYV